MTKSEALSKQLEQWQAQKANLLKRVADLDIAIELLEEEVEEAKIDERRHP